MKYIVQVSTCKNSAHFVVLVGALIFILFWLLVNHLCSAFRINYLGHITVTFDLKILDSFLR